MYENICISKPNFCIGPQVGTYCTVTTDSTEPIMNVVNNSGNPIRSYTFYPEHTMAETPGYYDINLVYHPADTLNDIVKDIKYIGPLDQSSYYDGLIFYTLENWQEDIVSYDLMEEKWLKAGNYYKGAVRRWKLNVALNRLELDATFSFEEDRHHSGKCNTFSVETIQTEFRAACGKGASRLELTSTSGIAVGDYLLLGPSSDSDNVGAIEYVYVHDVIDNDVEIRTVEGYLPPLYDYRYTDSVLVFRDVFIFQEPKVTIKYDGLEVGDEWHSVLVFAGDMYNSMVVNYEQNYGILTRLDQRNYGVVIDEVNSGIYKGITASGWYDPWKALACVREGITLFMVGVNDLVNPYQVVKSLVLFNNYLDPISFNSTIIPIYAIAFYGDSIYKLQKSTVRRSDDGTNIKIDWTTYNYQLDTLIPYAFSTQLVMENAWVGPDFYRNIIAIIRDQYGIALSNKNTWFSFNGDADARLDSSYEVTDIDGKAYNGYSSGRDYQGDILLSVYTDGGSIAITGSQYVICSFVGKSLSFISTFSSMLEQMEKTITTFSSTPGLDNGMHLNVMLRSFVASYPVEIHIWSKTLYYPKVDPSYVYGIWSVDKRSYSLFEVDQTSVINYEIRENFIIQGKYPANNLMWWLTEDETDSEGSSVGGTESQIIKQITAQDTYDVEQLYISRHYNNDNHKDTVTIDQFQFIVESIPAFWSYKNPINTDIWIRLRPFAYSLNPNTFKYKIHEISTYAGDLGWRDITSEGAIIQFDAGGGLYGLEFLRTIDQFKDYFKYNSIVYVYIEVYDTSPVPNRIIIEFWFRTIPDYKSPFIENEKPSREAADVPIDTTIEFDLLDYGAGPDMKTLMMYVDQRRVWDEDYTYTTISGLDMGVGYHVVITPPHHFYYDKDVLVAIVVSDVSDNKNTLYDKWQFYCASAEGPWFDEKHFRPGLCARGVYRYTQDVSFQVYGIGNGVDPDSIEVHIGGKKRTMSIKPIVYREG